MSRGDICPFQGEDDDVGLDGGRVDGNAVQGGQPLGQGLGVGVIVGQALHHLRHGHNARGGDHPGLAHPAAHRLAIAPRFADEGPLPTTTDPTGAANPLLKQRLTLSASFASRAGRHR